jgi:hypothetical protein
MRRYAGMNNIGRLAVTAAAAMVAVAGITLLSPPSSPSATAQPLGTRHTVTEKGVRFSFWVPELATPPVTDGWQRFKSISTDKSPGGPISLNRDVVGSQTAEAIIYWTSFPHGDYADSCARLLKPPIGRSVADLATAVSTAPGTKLVKGPSNVILGGHPAKHVVLTIRKDVGCDPGFFYTWRWGYGGPFWPTTVPGDTVQVWIVSVHGTRLFIEAATTKQADMRLRTEARQIVESIRFG